MKYHWGTHTPEEWLEITGVDPRNHPEIHIGKVNRFCCWTPAAERIVAARTAEIHGWYRRLGISCG